MCSHHLVLHAGALDADSGATCGGPTGASGRIAGAGAVIFGDLRRMPGAQTRSADGGPGGA